MGPVVVDVSPGSFPGLADGLRRLPALVEERPLLTFAPPEDWAPMDSALDGLSRYDALRLHLAAGGDGVHRALDA